MVKYRDRVIKETWHGLQYVELKSQHLQRHKVKYRDVSVELVTLSGVTYRKHVENSMVMYF